MLYDKKLESNDLKDIDSLSRTESHTKVNPAFERPDTIKLEEKETHFENFNAMHMFENPANYDSSLL